MAKIKLNGREIDSEKVIAINKWSANKILIFFKGNIVDAVSYQDETSRNLSFELLKRTEGFQRIKFEG